jgi:hypothetical protein
MAPLAAKCAVLCGLPVPGQQLVKAVDRSPPGDDPLEHIGQIGPPPAKCRGGNALCEAIPPLCHATNASFLGPPSPVRRIRQQDRQRGRSRSTLLHPPAVLTDKHANPRAFAHLLTVVVTICEDRPDR